MDYRFPSLLTEHPVLILGLGETGLAAALWCARAGVPLRVVDTRDDPPGRDRLLHEVDASKIEFFCGSDALSEAHLTSVSNIVVSPGLAPNAPGVQTFLAKAHERSIEVISEIELFARALNDLCEQGYKPRVLAVTGTNGKTTVTAMTRHLVQGCGLSAVAAGNISPAALTALMDALDAGQLPDVWVLELSSFQLVSTHSLKPDAAVVLNISEDHLDWHGSFQAYMQAKARLLQWAEVAIVNRDDANVCAMIDALDTLSVRSFGMGRPLYVGDLGLDEEHGVSWLLASEPEDFEIPQSARRRKDAVKPTRKSGRVMQLMPSDALRVRGSHNAMNALAALLMVRALGQPWAPLLHAVRDYAGEPNRTEFVRSVAGVDFINDSKGTNVGATVAALEGLGQRVVLIAGGLAKGQDFSLLAKSVSRHAAGVVLIGRDAKLIEEALAHTNVPLVHAGNMEAAVMHAMSMAQPGHAVLLSPACASMDMFKNYVHRAQVFIDAVNALALDHGEVA
ncbi:MAG: UDP-N-acetylmuramoyl-L-alanine--D-glutamate ligase [Pusillimonas sp.]|mgnify:CR=1 FL=1|nr:UDP-N-acetylmuramoyl-L-alanine--D-glutamate ligase [Pusillimonas sp.]